MSVMRIGNYSIIVTRRGEYTSPEYSLSVWRFPEDRRVWSAWVAWWDIRGLRLSARLEAGDDEDLGDGCLHWSTCLLRFASGTTIKWPFAARVVANLLPKLSDRSTDNVVYHVSLASAPDTELGLLDFALDLGAPSDSWDSRWPRWRHFYFHFDGWWWEFINVECGPWERFEIWMPDGKAYPWAGQAFTQRWRSRYGNRERVRRSFKLQALQGGVINAVSRKLYCEADTLQGAIEELHQALIKHEIRERRRTR